jgi:hypothetical protein
MLNYQNYHCSRFKAQRKNAVANQNIEALSVYEVLTDSLKNLCFGQDGHF